jgi:hypothetical protein
MQAQTSTTDTLRAIVDAAGARWAGISMIQGRRVLRIQSSAV